MKIDFKKYTVPEIFIKAGKKWIYDDIRKMNVLLTPEEIVRQKVIRFLLDEIKVPKYMIHIEALLSNYRISSNRRADILILKKDESKGIPIPLAVIECKAPSIILSNNNYECFEQVLDYAYPLSCDYIVLTNGKESVVAAWDFELEQYRDIKMVPKYEDMLNNTHEWLEE